MKVDNCTIGGESALVKPQTYTHYIYIYLNYKFLK